MYFFTLDEVIDACMAYMRAEFIPALGVVFALFVITMILCIYALVKNGDKKEDKK